MNLRRFRLWLLHHVPALREERLLGAILLRVRALLALPLCIFRRPCKRSLKVARLCFGLIPKYTMVSPRMLFELDDLTREVLKSGVRGSIVECGVWNGGSAAIMAATARDCSADVDYWLFDSFEGLPKPTDDDPAEVQDYYFQGWNTGTAERAREAMQRVGVDPRRLNICAGWFEDTFPQQKIDSIAVLHIDSDWYESVLRCLEAWFDKVAVGGVIILNDYNQWHGCNKAVADFIERRKLQITIHDSGKVGAHFFVS